jgi:hypothetical protein
VDTIESPRLLENSNCLPILNATRRHSYSQLPLKVLAPPWHILPRNLALILIVLMGDFENGTKYINLDNSGLVVKTTGRPWPRIPGERTNTTRIEQQVYRVTTKTNVSQSLCMF